MSAEKKLSFEQIPIFMAGDCGSDGNLLNTFIAQLTGVGIQEQRDVTTGLRQLIRVGRGVLVLEVKNRAELTQFAKGLQKFVKIVKLSDLKILIFSDEADIVTNRTLTQFSFIRTSFKLPDAKMLAAFIFKEYSELEGRLRPKEVKKNSGSGGVMIIESFPTADDKPALAIPMTEQRKQQLLRSCIGIQIPSFLYDKSCLWRVRGHFNLFNPERDLLTFKANDEVGHQRIAAALNEIGYIVSSVSSPLARICMTLDYQGCLNREFIFKTPIHIQEIQRRTSARISVAEQAPVIGQFIDATTNEESSYQVLDISSDGIGLRIDRDLAVKFKPGQRISNLTLVLPQKTIRILTAEVRHCSRSDKNPEFKILGIKFVDCGKEEKLFLDLFVDIGKTAL